MKSLYKLRLNLQYFSDPNPPVDPPQDPPPTDPPNDPPVTYTQEQLDTQITDAKKATETQVKADFYKKLGVESFKDLQDKLGASRTKEEADAVLRTTNETLSSENGSLKTELAFVKAATSYKPHDADILFATVKPLLQTDPDSGEITNMKEVLEQVKTDKPFLFMSEESTGGGQGGGGQQRPGSTAPGGGTPPASKTDYDLGAELAKKRSQKN
ncbi:phage scaffolding protein [Bacillus sp. F9_6S_D1_P_5]